MEVRAHFFPIFKIFLFFIFFTKIEYFQFFTLFIPLIHSFYNNNIGFLNISQESKALMYTTLTYK